MPVVVTEKQIHEVIERLKNEYPERWNSIKYLRSVPIGEIDGKKLEEDGDKNRNVIHKIAPEINIYKKLTSKERAETRFYINDVVRDFASSEIKSESK